MDYPKGAMKCGFSVTHLILIFTYSVTQPIDFSHRDDRHLYISKNLQPILYKPKLLQTKIWAASPRCTFSVALIGKRLAHGRSIPGGYARNLRSSRCSVVLRSRPSCST